MEKPNHDLCKFFRDHRQRLADASPEVLHLANLLEASAFDGCPAVKPWYDGPAPLYLEQAEYILANPDHREAVIRAMEKQK